MPLALEGLRCFVEAARLLSFRAAARAVALSPAALGQRIRQLEEELGVRLFQRTTRTVVLTEAGLGLLPQATRALAAVEECRRAGRGELGPAPLEIVLGTRHELGLSWVVPLLERLERAHPALTVHLYFGSGADLVRSVRSLAIDCAITSSRLTDPKLDAYRLHEEKYVFVGQRELLLRQPLRHEADARAHTLFDAAEELPLFRYWRDAPGGIDSLRFGRIVRLGTIAAIRALVLRGKGVAVLPHYFVRQPLAAGEVRRILPKVRPLSDHFRLVFRGDDPKRSLYASLAKTLCGVPLK
ncbi:MAG: LysR family transcriptional regulator [Deltaproteobacteria bacterium]|nr:LysR family transcriptional regulator [Deltaproteobacteria bacterium]